MNQTISDAGVRLINPATILEDGLSRNLGSSSHSRVILPSALEENMEQEHPHLAILPNNNIMLPPVEPVKSNTTTMISYGSLTRFDVLLGRGHGTNYYRGNRWFRKILDCYRNAYCLAPKGEKKLICENICNFIRLKGGRFLERFDAPSVPALTHPNIALAIGNKVSLDSSLWYECGDSKAQAKIGQNLREGHANMMRQTLKQSLRCFGENKTIEGKMSDERKSTK
jgi:hypothetical protein